MLTALLLGVYVGVNVFAHPLADRIARLMNHVELAFIAEVWPWNF